MAEGARNLRRWSRGNHFSRWPNSGFYKQNSGPLRTQVGNPTRSETQNKGGRVSSGFFGFVPEVWRLTGIVRSTILLSISQRV